VRAVEHLDRPALFRVETPCRQGTVLGIRVVSGVEGGQCVEDEAWVGLADGHHHRRGPRVVRRHGAELDAAAGELDLADAIVHAHHGTIHAGNAARFTVELPGTDEPPA